MPQSVALSDLVAPYFLKGNDLNGFHAALSVLRVVFHDEVADPLGIFVRGRAEFQGSLSIPGPNGALFQFRNDETDPPYDPRTASPVFDLAETSVDFELFVPRTASQTIAAGVASLATDNTFANARTVLGDWGTPPFASPSDFPADAFALDLLVNAPRYRPTFLRPAKMTPDGLLLGDPTFKEVVITLPKLRFRLSQNITGAGVRLDLLSVGVDSLEDPTAVGSDLAAAELVSMTPPYAFIGGSNVGVGFRSATLDLSTEITPPDVLSRIGVGDDWTGLYLPELRLFVGGGASGFAFEIGARDFLIGFGVNSGVSGDFEAALISLGDGDLVVGVRFFDATGRAYGLTTRDGENATATIPAQTSLVVDVEGGRAPYTVNVAIDGAPGQSGRIFALNLDSNPTASILVTVSDATVGTPKTARLTIAAQRGDPRVVIVSGGTPPGPAQQATLATTPNAEPRIVVKEQTDQFVTLTTEPADSATVWSLDGAPDTSPRANFTIEVPTGSAHTVKASLPAVQIAPVQVYFYFDNPPQAGPTGGSETNQIMAYARQGDNAWTTMAIDRLPAHHREAGGSPALSPAQIASLTQVLGATNQLTITGQASYENDDSKLERNFMLARRRAIVARELITQSFGGSFNLTLDPPADSTPATYGPMANWIASWHSHSDRPWWRADVTWGPALDHSGRSSQGTLKREVPAPGTPAVIQIIDPPPPNPPDTPDWFRSAMLKMRVIENRIIAVEVDGDIDIQTAAEEKLRKTGQVDGVTPDQVRTLKSGQPIGASNPGDGQTHFRFLIQQNETTDELTVTFSIGADPADTDGLAAIGWMPGETRDARRLWRNLLGSYLSFWPLLVASANRDVGAPVNAVITGAELAIPPLIAALPWFRVERIILFGAEYLARWQVAGSEANIYFDIETDWSIAIPNEQAPLIQVGPDPGVKIRYKAIGLRFADIDENGASIQPRYDFRPVFDSSRGYTLDLTGASGVTVRPPFDRILKVFAARLSRVNPLTFEIEIGVGIDFGVVSFDRMGVRVYLDQNRPPELTSIGASVDIPGGIAGQGYLTISDNLIGGQIDITVRPINLRIAAALQIANIDAAHGGPATGLYLGLELRLPVGIPLGCTGLGLYGFRGLFGMHYARNEAIGQGKAVPTLEWLKAAGGRPNLIENNGVILWEPKIDHWAFGVGVILGTMDGGIILNLDGTLMLELPGPSIVIAMSARFLMPPPSMDEAGAKGGILAVIEITPEHIAIGIFATYEIEKLLKVSIPAEAFFATGDLSKWHFYLGARPDIADGPGPAIVRVLEIVQGTGYLMIRGDGLPAYAIPDTGATLPQIRGFGIGLGAAASFVWGSTGAGLYLKVGGGFDAVVGFDPLMISAVMTVVGELRLFVVSVGANASLAVTVREEPNGHFPPPIGVKVEGKACGHVDCFFFEISECVSISIGSEPDEPPIPTLVTKLALKSRSPALVKGSATDRPVDGSLGDAAESAEMPAAGQDVPVVAIDSIPVIALAATPGISGAAFFGTAVPNPPNLPSDGLSERGGEKYGYSLTDLKLERVAPDGSVRADTLIGSSAPSRWWTQSGAVGNPSPVSLALLTWDLDPAAKAIETSDERTQTIKERWGTVCDDAAEAVSVLWTFRLESLGPDPNGWMLAGMPWPDPPNTRRSQPADASLRVRETWRTGRAAIDAARGIIPATVIGGGVPCQRARRLARALAQSVRIGGRGPVAKDSIGSAIFGWRPAESDPVVRLLLRTDDVATLRVPEVLYGKAQAYLRASPAQDQAATLAALAQGAAVSRADVVGALSALGSSATGRKSPCEARMLQSPLLDDGTLQRFGDAATEEKIKETLEKLGLRHGPLDDVVVLEPGPFKLLRLLLFIPPLGTVIVRVLDANGEQIARHEVVSGDFLPPKTLPKTWTSPDSPWTADVSDVLALAANDNSLGRWRPALVELDGGDKALHVEIGRLPDPDHLPVLMPFYLGVIEVLRLSEYLRQDYDNEQIGNERKQVTALVGEDATDCAFLYPNSLYRCALSWTGKRASTGKSGNATQTFWFRTDGQAPARLDPFVVMTTPAEGEANCFGAEPPAIVFATHDIARLYGAYGQELKVRIQASSGRHPPGQNGGAAQVPVSAGPIAKPSDPIDLGQLVSAGAGLLSPFEDALSKVLGDLEKHCIPVNGERTRQTVLTVPIPLEPFTNYILDIVAVPSGTQPDQFTPFVLRRHFSTGAYGTLAAFAAQLAGLTIGNRGLAANATAANLAAFLANAPVGEQLDAALRNAGVDVSDAPKGPSVTILWEPAAGGAQPTAVLIDADDPLWRERPCPTLVSDPTALPGTTRWEMADRTWLSLQPDAASASFVNGTPIRAPGSQRALVLLKPGSRGKRLKLELVRAASPEPWLAIAEERCLALDVLLSAPPWEL